MKIEKINNGKAFMLTAETGIDIEFMRFVSKIEKILGIKKEVIKK